MRVPALLLAVGLVAASPAQAAPQLGGFIKAGQEQCINRSAGPTEAPFNLFGVCNLGHGAVSVGSRAFPGQIGMFVDMLNSRSGLSDAEAQASFNDSIRFKKLDPAAPDEFRASLNLHLSGNILLSGNGLNDALGAQFVLGGAFGNFNGVFFANAAQGAFTIIRSGLGETMGFGPFNDQLVTPEATFNFFGGTSLQVPISFLMRVNGTNGSPLGRTTVDILNTFGFPTDRPVFNLPDGYTAEAGDYLVNNRFIVPGAAVPEPGSWVLMIAGFAFAGGAARVRRPDWRRLGRFPG